MTSLFFHTALLIPNMSIISVHHHHHHHQLTHNTFWRFVTLALTCLSTRHYVQTQNKLFCVITVIFPVRACESSSDKQQRNVCESTWRCLAQCSKWMSSTVKRLWSFISHVIPLTHPHLPSSLSAFYHICTHLGDITFIQKGLFTIVLKDKI